MPDIIPNISLNAIDFKPIAFQPVQYQDVQPDPQIMPRSLQVQDSRTKESGANIDAIDSALSAIRSQLDVHEHPWLDERAAQIRERLDEQAALGNTQTAIRFAREEAKALKRDAELADKATVNAKRQKAIQSIQQNNTYSEASKRRFAAVNEYKFNGNAEWEPIWNPVAREYTAQDIISIAGQLTAPDSGGYQKSNVTPNLLDYEGKQTDDLSKVTRMQSKTTHGEGSNFSKKTKEDMQQTMADMLLQPEYYNGLKQNYESQLWAYNDALNKAQDETLTDSERKRYLREADKYAYNLKDEDGFIAGYSEEQGATDENFDKWIRKHVTPMFRNMEYYNLNTNSNDNLEVNESILARNNAAAAADRYSVNEKVNTQGESAVTTYKSPSLANAVDKAFAAKGVELSSLFN